MKIENNVFSSVKNKGVKSDLLEFNKLDKSFPEYSNFLQGLIKSNIGISDQLIPVINELYRVENGKRKAMGVRQIYSVTLSNVDNAFLLEFNQETGFKVKNK